MASSRAMEESYVNVEEDVPVDTSPSTNRTGPRSSKLKNRSDGAVFLSLGLLSVFLLARLISFFVYYRAGEDKLSYVSEERDLLNTSLTNLTEEMDRLQRLSTNLIKEMDRLQRLCEQKNPCPEGWKMFRCSCYLLSNKSGSWIEGRKDCRDKGADLVITDSLEEQKFLKSIVDEPHTWIGLSDRDNENIWKWVDGTPMTEMFWDINEPNNGGGDLRFGEEDCVEIRRDSNAEGNWNDQGCYVAPRKWICEDLA